MLRGLLAQFVTMDGLELIAKPQYARLAVIMALAPYQTPVCATLDGMTPYVTYVLMVGALPPHYAPLQPAKMGVLMEVVIILASVTAMLVTVVLHAPQLLLIRALELVFSRMLPRRAR
jgi:hypothetical protein